MILGTVVRMIWVVTSFVIAALAAFAVLLTLGSVWVGDELRAAAPDDPLFEQGAPIFGLVLFAGTVGPALTALPGLIAVVAGEAFRIRSWMYFDRAADVGNEVGVGRSWESSSRWKAASVEATRCQFM